jgi:hypothetical protein
MLKPSLAVCVAIVAVAAAGRASGFAEAPPALLTLMTQAPARL